jgi:hypothetical protein
VNATVLDTLRQRKRRILKRIEKGRRLESGWEIRDSSSIPTTFFHKILCGSWLTAILGLFGWARANDRDTTYSHSRPGLEPSGHDRS